MHDAVGDEPGTRGELDDRRVRHRCTDTGQELDASLGELVAYGFGDACSERLERFALGRHERQSPRLVECREHQREFVCGQRPCRARRHDDRDLFRELRAQVGKDVVEGLGILGTLEPDPVFVCRHRPGTDCQDELVVPERDPGPEQHGALVAVDLDNCVANEGRVEVGGELSERVAVRAAQAERLEHLERTDAEVLLRRDERDREPVADETAQRDGCLETSDACARDDDMRTLRDGMRFACHVCHRADPRSSRHPLLDTGRVRRNYGAASAVVEWAPSSSPSCSAPRASTSTGQRASWTSLRVVLPSNSRRTGP
jgi:hypothetical protein